MYVANLDKAAGIVGCPQGSTGLAPFTSEMAHEVPKGSWSLRICELAHNYICVVLRSVSCHLVFMVTRSGW